MRISKGTAHVRCFGEKVTEARVRWFGHVQRRDSEYICRRMMRLELPDRRSRGRGLLWTKEDFYGSSERGESAREEGADRVRWRQVICCGNP